MTIFFTTHYLAEAEQVAEKIAIIDKGKIISQGTLEELKQANAANSLEEAYLKLTKTNLRDTEAGVVERLRMRHKTRRR